MAGLFKARSKPFEEGDVEFWHNPERAGWLMKQGENEAGARMHAAVAFVHSEQSDAACLAGEYIKTWRRRCCCSSTAL